MNIISNLYTTYVFSCRDEDDEKENLSFLSADDECYKFERKKYCRAKQCVLLILSSNIEQCYYHHHHNYTQ